MSNDKLYVLISTMDSRILKLKAILQSYNKQIVYIVSHQITGDLNQNILNYIENLAKREDVEYSFLVGQGVAKNRNNTLRFIKPSSLCLILDDDILLCQNALKNVIKSFNDNMQADFISFKILDLDGNDSKSYPKEKQWHTLRTLTGIGTTEMAFKSDLILKKSMEFDERFGPGSDMYPIGEDFIFAMDLYNMKIKMLFLPMPIVKHPRDSTGGSLHEKVIFGRGAMFARVFGWTSFVVNLLFAIKKYSYYRKEMSFLSYLRLLTTGTIDYLRKNKGKML